MIKDIDQNIPLEDIEFIFQEYDSDNSGSISKNEFLQVFSQVSLKNCNPEEKLNKALIILIRYFQQNPIIPQFFQEFAAANCNYIDDI